MADKYLVCYDIADDKRLHRVYKFTKQYGIHLQYSVFICSFTEKQLKNYVETLANIIDPKADDIRIYPLAKEPKIYALGCAELIPDGVFITI